MFNELTNSEDAISGGVGFGAQFNEQSDVHGQYLVECFDADGNLKWSDTIENLVTTAGKNFLLDTTLNGSAYTATWYIGLIGSTSYSTGPNVADTMASHSGWAECGGATAPLYSQSARPTCNWSTAASGGTKQITAALTYSIVTTGGTIKGCFLTTVSTKDGTTGTLYSAGLFSGGDKIVSPSDTLNVTYSTTVS